MPRAMPPLAKDFRQRVSDALGLVQAGELARAEAGPRSKTWRALHPSRLQILYEIAYLRIFVAWEVFLEETFHRYLCGFASHAGLAALAPSVSYSKTLGAAQARVLTGRPFKLWHDPDRVMTRSARFFAKGPHEVVIGSHLARLHAMASVRHRIAHAHDDAKANFDGATMTFTGLRYRGSRPGLFLRDLDPASSSPRRWLDTLGQELSGIAAQVA